MRGGNMAVTNSAQTSPLAARDGDRSTGTPNWIVAVSPGESANETLLPATASAAHAAFGEHGCVLLRGAFQTAIIDAMFDEFRAQFGAMSLPQMRERATRPGPNRVCQVGEARYDLVLRLTGALGRQEVFANGILLKLLRPLLGADMLLNSFTAVVSHPNAPVQRVHRDYPHLFAGREFDRNVSVAHAVNVVVPLIDVDLETGPTGVWLGSHLWERTDAPSETMTVSSLQRGDCMLLDYRLLHAGLPNRTGRARPIVYMVYARPWFFDQHNHLRTGRIPLDIPLERYDELPSSVRPLMGRAHYFAMLSRWNEAKLPPAPAAAL
jgi:ectoine hydroxylase-related dioxygenase (phytanoyl-CoA dioxygenase family)